MSHRHLTVEEREIIAFMHAKGHPQVEIATAVNKSQSTISRELHRNRSRDGRYRPVAAQRKARRRRRGANQVRGRKLDHSVLRVYVRRRLKKYWSPEQIAGRMLFDHPADPFMRISHETIYAWIWEDKRRGGLWYKRLRQGHKKYKRRSRGKPDGRKNIPNRRWIDDRPAVVARKDRVGDWEGDTILGRGKKHAVISFAERVSQYVVLGKMNARTWHTLNATAEQAFARHNGSVPLPRETLTVDNGREFWGHEDLGRKLDLCVYFARPYQPWQRGLNEQIIGLVRQFIPKSTDLRTVTEKEMENIELLLNNRPRKTLGYRTPLEIMRNLCQYAFRV